MQMLEVKKVVNNRTGNETYWYYCSVIGRFIRMGAAKMQALDVLSVSADSFLTQHLGAKMEQYKTLRFADKSFREILKRC